MHNLQYAFFMRSKAIKRIKNNFFEFFLIKELADIKGLKRFWIRWIRIFTIAVKEFLKNKCTLTASALTYVTLVSIVPVLAFAFSIGKGLGFQDKLKDFLIDKISSSVGLSGNIGVSNLSLALEKIFNYIEKTNFETLGVIGVIMLVYLVIKLLGSIEGAFNDIYGVSVQRNLARKISDYLSVIVIFPLFVLIAATFTAVLTSNKFMNLLYSKGNIGLIIKILLGYSPYLFLWLAFFAIYMFMPNTKVRFLSALIGGIIGGTLWQVVQWAYFHFQVGISRYNIIYSTLAALPIFLAWLYVSWLILLFGAEIAFAHQFVESYSFSDISTKLVRKAKELIALSIVTSIARRFLEGAPPFDIMSLSEAMGTKPDVIKPVLNSLCGKNIIYISQPNNVYLLSVAPDKLLTLRVLDAISEDFEANINFNRIDRDVYKFYTSMERTIHENYKAHTIADIIS